jgi:hypothetical protein
VGHGRRSSSTADCPRACYAQGDRHPIPWVGVQNVAIAVPLRAHGTVPRGVREQSRVLVLKRLAIRRRRRGGRIPRQRIGDEDKRRTGGQQRVDPGREHPLMIAPAPNGTVAR